MARSCAFCDNPADSKEHAWAQWISRLFPSTGRFLVEGGYVGGPQQRRFAPRMDLAVKRVCTKCNTGWMSRLEDEAKPIILRLLKGREIVLSVDEQLIIARWVLKTVMVLEFTGAGWRKQYFLLEERRNFRDTLSIPSRTDIWLACYVGVHAGQATDHAVPTRASSRGTIVPGYESTFSAGCFAAQLFSHRWTRPLAVSDRVVFSARGGEWDKATAQIWPILGPQRWPPQLGFDDVSWADFATRWVGAKRYG